MGDFPAEYEGRGSSLPSGLSCFVGEGAKEVIGKKGTVVLVFSCSGARSHRQGRIPLREGRPQGLLVRCPVRERGACCGGAPRWGDLCLCRQRQVQVAATIILKRV